MLSGSFLKNLNHVEIDFINKNKIPEIYLLMLKDLVLQNTNRNVKRMMFHLLTIQRHMLIVEIL